MSASWAVAALVAALAALLLAAEGDAADGYGLAGPFRVIIERLDPCPASVKLDAPYWVHFKMRRDRSRVGGRHTTRYFVTTNTTFSFVVNDSVEGAMDVESWSSRGGWKPNAYNLHVRGVCSFLERNVPDFCRRIMDSIFRDPDHKCPVPPGNYLSTNLSTEIDKDWKNVPAFFYGKYRTTFRLVDTASRRRLACWMGIGSVVPKYVQQR